jgi:hypothetical protein
VLAAVDLGAKTTESAPVAQGRVQRFGPDEQMLTLFHFDGSLEAPALAGVKLTGGSARTAR